MHLTKKWQQLLYALAITTLTLLAMFLVTQIAFGGRETKLSSNAACMAVQPRVAQAAPWMAAVWIEDNGECETEGKAMLQAAQYDAESGTYAWWTAPFTVENGSTSAACVTHADVAIKDGIAHIVVAKRQDCGQPAASLFYRTCNLTNRSCGELQRIANTGTGNSATDVNITVDTTGKPHVVYGTASNDPPNGEIYYTYYDDWPDTTTNLSITSTELITDYRAYRPRIAWSNNRLHVVWDGQIETGNGVPIYRYCNADGTCPAAGGPYNLEDAPWDTQGMETDAKPVVAAQGHRVLVAWQYCSDYNDGTDTCERFQLLYKYSDSNGNAGTFIASTQAVRGTWPHDSGPTTGYPGTDDGNAGYASHLNPSLALDANQNPIFVWQQFNTKDTMMITTTVGATPTTGGGFTSWRHPYGWAIGTDDGYNTRVQPQILMPSSSSPLTPSLHLFYMKKATTHSGYNYRIDYLYLEEGVLPSTEEEPTATGSPSVQPTEDPGGSKVYLPLVSKNFSGE